MIRDDGLGESLHKEQGIWSSSTVPQRPSAKQEYLVTHKNMYASTPIKYVVKKYAVMLVYLSSVMQKSMHRLMHVHTYFCPQNWC